MVDRNEGERSRKHDSDNGGRERPLKKARYEWQVKGKYHLKNNQNSECRRMENNTTCSDRCLETLFEHSEMITDVANTMSIDKTILEEIPVTLVTFNNENEDYYLNRWQARQVAKGFVDNSINRVLEKWKIAPFDASDYVENCDSDGKVEDEGILMAIQSHGLHSNWGENINKKEDKHTIGGSWSFLNSSEITESALDNFANEQSEYSKQNHADESSCSGCCVNVEKAANIECLEMGNQIDFLSAAVSAAIQEKGLASYDIS